MSLEEIFIFDNSFASTAAYLNIKHKIYHTIEISCYLHEMAAQNTARKLRVKEIIRSVNEAFYIDSSIKLEIILTRSNFLDTYYKLPSYN